MLSLKNIVMAILSLLILTVPALAQEGWQCYAIEEPALVWLWAGIGILMLTYSVYNTFTEVTKQR